MNLLCKSSIDESQLNARENLIHNGIELQLLADFSELPNTAIVNSLGKNLKQIKAVHAPLKELIPCEEMLRQFTVGHERGFLAQAMHMYDDFLRGKLKLPSNFKDWKE